MCFVLIIITTYTVSKFGYKAPCLVFVGIYFFFKKNLSTQIKESSFEYLITIEDY